MNRADRLRKVAPGAPPEVISELALRPSADVDLIVAAIKAARADALAEDVEKRQARRQTRARDEEDHTAATLRIIKATGKRAAVGRLEALEGLAQFGQMISEVLGLAVDGCRDRGYSDREIGEALGVTQQAVSKRWPRPVPGVSSQASDSQPRLSISGAPE